MDFPGQNVRMYLLIDEDMTDITPDVRGSGDIRIKTGYTSESARISASEMTFTINDQEKPGKILGRYVNRNPRSDLFEKLGRNLPVRCSMAFNFTDANGAYSDTTDTFTRSVSGGWGTASGSGTTWGTASVGSSNPSDWDVTGSQGTHYVDAANEARLSYLTGLTATDVDVYVTFTCPQATGGVLEPANIMWRWATSVGSYGMTRVEINTSNQVIIRIYGVGIDDAGGSPLASVTTSVTHTGTGQPLRLRTRVWGRYVWAKVWVASTSEPAAWDIFVTDNESTNFQGGTVAIRSGRGSGNTNTTDPQFSYDNFSLTVEIPRFLGELPEWIPNVDQTGKDLTIDLSAGGILRRITAPTAKSLNSAVRRYIDRRRTTAAYYYLPLEEESSATLFTPAIDAEAFPTIVITEDIASPGADATSFKGSKPLPTLGTSFLSTGPINGQNTGTIAVGFLLHLLDAGHTDATELFQVLVSNNTTISRWSIRYSTSNNGSIGLYGLDSSGGTVVNTGNAFTNLNGAAVKLALNLVQDGADVDYSIYIGRDQTTTLLTSGTFAGRTVGAPVRLGWNGTGAFEGATIGHAVLSTTDINVSQFETSPWGYNGEEAGTRFERLCEEEGISAQIIGDADTQMGPQSASTLITLLQEIQDAEQGYLFEPTAFLGIGLLSRGSLINRSVSFEFDYSGNKLFRPLAPIEDEQYIVNKFTATRRDGGSATSEVSVGPLSTQDHPDGVGIYDSAREFNVFADSQLVDIAGWNTHRGTFDRYRFASMVFDLVKFDPVSQAELLIALAGVGTRYQVINLPDWLPPEPLDELVIGFDEWIMNNDNERGWRFTYRTAPFAPYHIGLLNTASSDDEDFRVDVWEPGTPGRRSTLAASVNTTATSLSVASTGFLWTTGTTVTNATDFPMDIMIDGERMTVTAISGTSSPQTFTVTRSVNGIVKSHSAGTAPEVRPFMPWVISY